MAEAALRAFLDDLSPESRTVALALRSVVLRTVPQAAESVVWGGLSYHRPEVGGRVKGAVCQIVARRGAVRLDFIHGVRLTDSEGLLRGDRLSKRYVPIATAADAERPGVAALIRQAAALDPNTWDESVPPTQN